MIAIVPRRVAVKASTSEFDSLKRQKKEATQSVLLARYERTASIRYKPNQLPSLRKYVTY